MLCIEGKSLQVEAMLVVCFVRVYCSLMSDVTKPPEDSRLSSDGYWGIIEDNSRGSLAL